MKTKYFKIAITLLFLIIACKPRIVKNGKVEEKINSYELNGDDIFPEGICIDERNGAIYTGSLNGGGLQRTLNGKSSFFLQPGTSKVSKNILGCAIDTANNRLWVCSNDLQAFFQNQSWNPLMSVFDLSSGELIKSFGVDDFEETFRPLFGDVITDKLGNAYITNLSSTAVIRISVDFVKIDILDNFPKAPESQYYILNGLEISGDGKNLVVATYKTGYEGAIATLFKVSTENGAVSEIDCQESVADFKNNGIDGLAYVSDDVLLGVSGNGKLLRIILSPALKKAVIKDITGTVVDSILYEPSTLATLDGKVYTTNAQANRYFTNQEVTLPFHILEIPYSFLDL